jgi:hypothetical protein
MLHKRALLVLTLLGVGCRTAQPWSDYKETPIIERGACATVVLPGEQVPMGSQPNCPGGYSSIGGAVVYDEKDYQKGPTPKDSARAVAGVLGAPAAAGAAVAKRVTQNGREQASNSAGGGSGTHEQAEIERMQREIMQRERVGRSERTEPVQSAPPGESAGGDARLASRSASSASTSIADELAALRQASGGGKPPEGAASDAPVFGTATPPAPARTPAPSAGAAPPPAAADRVADRDGDGAPDHWIYRDASGRPVREQFDENGDARPDRTAWLDPVTGREARVEEDANLDGRVDTWVELVDGKPARQRRDTNHDGAPDAWAYYDREGRLTREELDLDGDGYRNREAIYRAGKLAKQREDRDGDGRFDLVTTYDPEERIARRDEDRDADGRIDTRSIYQAGKLVKREVVSEAIDDGDELSQTEW